MWSYLKVVMLYMELIFVKLFKVVIEKVWNKNDRYLYCCVNCIMRCSLKICIIFIVMKWEYDIERRDVINYYGILLDF